ncbi:hypothetical protein C8J57DRAFT_1178002 [Mycena rebaudengoi]|nr:hypothetical protein C8J57DRAFT_1178002 [Mycena rebaudengoi]
MESVATLRTRLGELATSIALQKKVLDDLERTRAHTQRQLNAILDPIARLPLEISSDIFLRCLPDVCRIHPSTAPILFLGICASWAKIALSTPALWATIHVDFPRAKGFERLFDSYLTRTRSRDLCLSLGGRIDPAIFPLLVQQAYRVKRLDLRQIRSNSDLLVTRTASFSNLKTLTLSAVGETSPAMIDINALLSMLGAAPGLVECTIDDIYTTGDRPAALTLPSLQSLYLGRDPRCCLCSSRILRYVTLPALRILLIYNLDIGADDMTSFLTRSAAPLKSLALRDPIDDWEIPSIARIFGLMPALANLRMFFVEPDANIFSLLDSSSNGIFPELRNLEITTAHGGDVRVWADTIYRTVSARRSQLGSARIVLPHGTNRPDPDVLDPFRQLVAECGMKVHFGAEELNLI